MDKRKLVLFDLDETLVHAFNPREAGITKEDLAKLRSDIHNRNDVARQQGVNPAIYDQPWLMLMLKESRTQPSTIKEEKGADRTPNSINGFVVQNTKWLGPTDKILIGEIEYVVVFRPYLISFIANAYKRDLFDMGIFSMGV
jgi:hypothetical protein